MFFKMYAMQMVSWGVYDVINYLSRSFFYGLCALVKLLLGFSWIEKGGLFLNVALFMGPQYTESVDGKQRKGFYVVSYSDEPCIEMVIFLYVPSVLVWKYFVMYLVRGWGGGGAGGREIRDMKVMETVITVF